MTKYNKRLNRLIDKAFDGKDKVRMGDIAESITETVDKENAVRGKVYQAKTKFYRPEQIIQLMRVKGWRKDGIYYVRKERK